MYSKWITIYKVPEDANNWNGEACYCTYEFIQQKYGVHSIIWPRQILFGTKFKTKLCKIGERVMAYNVTVNNKTARQKEFYALYIKLSNSGTCHIIFKLSTKNVGTTPKCKPKLMAEDIITIIDVIGRKEAIPDKIQFQSMHCNSTFYWNSNSNTLDFLWTPNTQQARRLFVWITFHNHHHCDLNIQDCCGS